MGGTRASERPGAVERRLPPQPSSVGEARHLVRDLLVAAERDDLIESAALLVSEVVTNALLHAGTPVDVRATLDEDGLRVEVGDGSPHLPVRRRYATTAGTGRGMMMIEHLVDEWGVSRHQHGKTVWFRLASREGGEPRPGEGYEDVARESEHSSETVTVELRNMPLLLHAAWQEHAEALLRELLLESLDSPDPVVRNPIQTHAEATDAIAILEEHVPRVGVAMDLAELMVGATEPNLSVPRLPVPVPHASVPHFETLDGAIEAALGLTRRGESLTPPTQPEIQAFRRWLCRQVTSQAAGADPVPWSVEGGAPPQPRYALEWDATEVSSASTGRIAADEANRILAVSPAALEILGYDDPGQLVGRRLVAIIPERYRQAHIAGFTLYLLVGRKPLLGRQVTVPALRRDGSEVQVEMLVEAAPAGKGRAVFLADLRRPEE